MREQHRDLARAAVEVLGLKAEADVHLLGEGQMSVAFVAVEGDTVIRFPRHELGRTHLRADRAMVGALAGSVTAVLPLPGRASLDAPIGWAHACHRLVRGRVLTARVVDDMGAGQAHAVVTQVATLLTELMGATDRLAAIPLPFGSLSDLSEDLRSNVESRLSSRLGIRAATRASDELDGMAAAGRTGQSLCHTDLGGSLIWDSATRQLGVIDFGGAILSDPVLDLASISVLGEDLTRSIAAATPHLTDRREDAQAIRDTFHLQDALLSARLHDWAAVDAALASY